MELAEFRKNFPPDTAIPSSLVKLLEYQNQTKDWYSGRFELIAEPYPELNAFDGDEVAASQFVHFGRNTDGSTYAFWLYPGQTLQTAPITFQGSEGTDWIVLAANLEDFFSLLALGETELGFAGARDYYHGPEYNLEELEQFRAWLKVEFGIEPPPNPTALVKSAQSDHPDLQAWLEDWQKHHFGDQ